MTARFGIDTSILIRLAAGDPEDAFERCLAALSLLIERDDAELFASNQVIGEAYVAIQHHYGSSTAGSTRGAGRRAQERPGAAPERPVGTSCARGFRRVRAAGPADRRRLPPCRAHHAHPGSQDGGAAQGAAALVSYQSRVDDFGEELFIARWPWRE